MPNNASFLNLPVIAPAGFNSGCFGRPSFQMDADHPVDDCVGYSSAAATTITVSSAKRREHFSGSSPKMANFECSGAVYVGGRNALRVNSRKTVVA